MGGGTGLAWWSRASRTWLRAGRTGGNFAGVAGAGAGAETEQGTEVAAGSAVVIVAVAAVVVVIVVAVVAAVGVAAVSGEEEAVDVVLEEVDVDSGVPDVSCVCTSVAFSSLVFVEEASTDEDAGGEAVAGVALASFSALVEDIVDSPNDAAVGDVVVIVVVAVVVGPLHSVARAALAEDDAEIEEEEADAADEEEDDDDDDDVDEGAGVLGDTVGSGASARPRCGSFRMNDAKTGE